MTHRPTPSGTDFPTSMANLQLWPGGWYIFENGAIEGPYEAHEAFALDGETAEGNIRYVSRKGFSQWYPLHDFSQIFRMSEELGRQYTEILAEETDRANSAHAETSRPGASEPAPSSQKNHPAPQVTGETPVERKREEQNRPGTEPTQPGTEPAQVEPEAREPRETPATSGTVETQPAPSTPAARPSSREGEMSRQLGRVKTARSKVQNKSVSPSTQSHKTKTAKKAPAVPPVTGEAKRPEPRDKASLTPMDKSYAAAGDEGVFPKTQTSSEGISSRVESGFSSTSQTPSRQTLIREYFLLRGRLRLGKIRNPWMTSFVGLPLTLGGYWVTWFGELAREVVWHCQSDDEVSLPHPVWSAFPLLHIFMIYRLAQVVEGMETQNHYRKVSPSLAACLAVFPPFAMAYLQSAVNQHWLLHVKHYLSKRDRA